MTRKLIYFFIILSVLSACNQTRETPPATGFEQSESTTKSESSPSTREEPVAEVVQKQPFTKIWETDGSSARGGTLHAIVVADTNDPSIGSSTQTDLMNMQALVTKISQHTGLTLTGGAITGNDFTLSHVNAAINGLAVRENDVVFFFYGGHGFNPGDGRWPAMSFRGRHLKMTEVRNLLLQKKPRLLIVMVDACNALSNRDDFIYSRATEKPENYRELFLNYRGTIVASSSKRGQYAWSNEAVGGLYTDAFLRNMNQELASSGRPSWKELMERANTPLMVNEVAQEPQSKVEVSYTGSMSAVVDCDKSPHLAECDFDVSSPKGAIPCRKNSYYTTGEQECCTLKNGKTNCWPLD